MSVTVFSGISWEFLKSNIIVEIFAILQVLDLKLRLLSRMGDFLIGVLVGFFYPAYVLI